MIYYGWSVDHVYERPLHAPALIRFVLTNGLHTGLDDQMARRCVSTHDLLMIGLLRVGYGLTA